MPRSAMPPRSACTRCRRRRTSRARITCSLSDPCLVPVGRESDGEYRDAACQSGPVHTSRGDRRGRDGEEAWVLMYFAMFSYRLARWLVLNVAAACAIMVSSAGSCTPLYGAWEKK